MLATPTHNVALLAAILPSFLAMNASNSTKLDSSRIASVAPASDTSFALVPKSQAPPQEPNVSFGVILACVAGLSVVAAAILLVTRRKEMAPPVYTPQEYEALDWRDLEAHRLDTTKLRMTSHVASGGTGDIFLGMYDGQKVAVKSLAITKGSSKHVQRFINEISLMVWLRSPHIVHLVGVVWTQPSDLQAVLEYMDLGDLRNFLARSKPATFPFNHKVACALSIAHALAHLHSLDVIHRDVKSCNVLLDSKQGTKLADFGIAKQLQRDPTLSAGRGTYRWMAPEMMLSHEYTTAVDMYSFGVLLSELDTHHEPFTDLVNGQKEPVDDSAVLCLVMHGHQHPSFREDCPSWFSSLAKECMAFHSEDRPTAADAIRVLREHYKPEPQPELL